MNSDPRLTSNVYTDASQLQTFQTVHVLPWYGEENENHPQIDTQKLVRVGHIESQTVTASNSEDNKKTPDYQGFSHGQTGSVEHSQMVEVAGVEPASQEVLCMASTSLACY